VTRREFSARMSPVYQPLGFFPWWFWFDAYAPHIFVEDAYVASAGGVAALIAIAMSVWRPQGRGAIAAPFHANYRKDAGGDADSGRR
jgi:type IV secretion system protein VirD4